MAFLFDLLDISRGEGGSAGSVPVAASFFEIKANISVGFDSVAIYSSFKNLALSLESIDVLFIVCYLCDPSLF